MMFLAALPRVARLPVGDLARLAAVAAFAARAADGEGGLIVSRESAADVAHPSTYPSMSGATRSVVGFPRFSLTVHATVKSSAARSAASKTRMSLGYLSLAIKTASARPLTSAPERFGGVRGSSTRHKAGEFVAAHKSQTRHIIECRLERNSFIFFVRECRDVASNGAPRRAHALCRLVLRFGSLSRTPRRRAALWHVAAVPR